LDQKEKIIEFLTIEINLLKIQYAESLKKIAALELENSSLKDKLNINSTNSSLPPSKDIYKQEAANKPKSTRRIGAQAGHVAHQRKLEIPDYIIECKLDTNCKCGGTIRLRSKKQTIQKAELPEIKPIFTNYILEKGVCRSCKKRRTASLPSGITPDLLGPRAKSIISTLTGAFNNSKKDVQSIMKDIFGLKICIGMIPKTDTRISEKCETYHKENLEILKTSPLLHIDETGFNVKTSDKRHWAWVLTNKLTALFHIADNRGKKVIEELLPFYDGYIISDRYGAYNIFDPEQRQICLAHILRDFARFANSSELSTSNIGKILVSELKEIFSLTHKNKNLEIDRIQLLVKTQKHISSIRQHLETILNFSTSKKVRGSAKNILKHESMMWKFLEVPWLDATNNHAERVLRNIVINRKTSFFVYGEKGKAFIERVKSLYLTSKLRGENFFSTLYQLAAA